MKNEEVVIEAVKKFYYMILNEQFIIDKTGCKMVELICEKLILDPSQPVLDFGVKKTNMEYCEHELEWYKSQKLDVTEIAKHAKLWAQIASKNGFVNSNYGWCIDSYANGQQYRHCGEELVANKESRRAVMIYIRPSMWQEYNKDGMSDFICTFATQCFIRDDKLHYVVNMRSNDFVYGFFNDFYFHCFVYNRMLSDLKHAKYPGLQQGKIVWIANSLHVYEKHFDMIKKIKESYAG